MAHNRPKSSTPAKHGCRTYGGRGWQDGATRWAVFPRPVDIQEALCCFPERQGGPGQFFSGQPHVRRSKSRVLITQGVGLDI